MRFQFITDQRDEFPVTLMCKVSNVSPSGYYAWRKRPPSAREMANRELVEKIEIVYNDNYGVYGSPRIYRDLKDQGVACSENRIARLMRLRGLQAKQSKRFKVTTKRNRAHPMAPNLLKRDFEADRPDQKWPVHRSVVSGVVKGPRHLRQYEWCRELVRRIIWELRTL